MPGRPVTVSILNDYEVVVAGLAAMLEPFADRVRVVDVGASSALREPVDVVLYDTFAAEHGAAVAYDDVRASVGATRLAVYCWHMRRELIDGALAKGASGYLSKQLPAKELVYAIERIAAGEVVVEGDLDTGAERPVVEWGPGDWPGSAEGLSEREAEILAWIARGLSNDDIAGKVFLSINTIKTHIRLMYRKMRVESRTQAVLWAIDHGFHAVEPPSYVEDAL